jgi:hypothetical protein
MEVPPLFVLQYSFVLGCRSASPALPCPSCGLYWVVTWPLAPVIHPVSSGSQAWRQVLGFHLAGSGLVGSNGSMVAAGVVVVTW